MFQGRFLSASCVFLHLASQPSSEKDTVVISISQIRKLRYDKVKSLVQSYQVRVIWS